MAAADTIQEFSAGEDQSWIDLGRSKGNTLLEDAPRALGELNALTIVREADNILHWVKFFLNGVVETSQRGVETFQRLLALRNECEAKLVNLGRRAENGRKFLIYLYSRPIITVADVQGLLDVGHKPANNLVKAFVDLEILKQVPERQRNRLFIFKKYLSLFNVPEEG